MQAAFKAVGKATGDLWGGICLAVDDDDDDEGRLLNLLLVSRAAECGQSVRSFGGSDAGALLEERRGDDEDHDMVMPHFQRVHISGEDTSGVSGQS